MNFDESTTKTNLARSFAGECQGGARYQFMAKQAQGEQLEAMSTIFKTLAKNEMAHAKLFYDYIIQNSKDISKIPLEAGYPFVDAKLEQSLPKEAEFELFEAQKVYPSFAKVAQDEGFLDIAKSFKEVAKIEQSHHEILQTLAEKFKKNALYKNNTETNFKCSNCGHIEFAKKAPSTCPVCHLAQGYYEIAMPLFSI